MWQCQKCGACCEVLMPKCKHYNSEAKLCNNYENRPWPCRQHHVPDEIFCIDSCELMRCLRDFQNKAIDKKRANRIIWILIKSRLGANPEQIKKMLKLTKDNKDEIKSDYEKYSYACLERVEDA